ncbi:MAG TPA: rod-binding protein, partial [Roseiarcus sp.]|nr:rod-binding protein [Roseiarcus sp.]
KALDSAASSLTPDVAGVASAANARARMTKKDLFASQKTHNAEVDFEASILGNFMNEILPKDSSDIYGQGEAGDIWRSMLGDQIAHQIAQSGQLGIAKRLFATHLLPHDASRAHASLGPVGGAADAAQASANLLSAPSGAEYANGAVLFASRKSS